jgi:hypothetical protein
MGTADDRAGGRDVQPEAPTTKAGRVLLEDVIMSEPWWPRAGAIRRRAVMEKIRARLSRSVASPEPSEWVTGPYSQKPQSSR